MLFFDKSRSDGQATWFTGLYRAEYPNYAIIVEQAASPAVQRRAQQHSHPKVSK